MKFFLNFLDRIGRKRIVMDRSANEPYLERYYIFLNEYVQSYDIIRIGIR